MTTPFPLGRLIEHDERSRAFAFPEGVSRKSVLWPITAPVLNQGNLGSCVGNAMAQLLNTVAFNKRRNAVNGGRFLAEPDAVSIYSKATAVDDIAGGYPPDDTGSSGLAVAKVAQALGYIDVYRHCFSWLAFQAAVQTQPVIVGTVWTEQMFEPIGGLATVGKINDATIAGGHEYLVRGIEFSSQKVRCRNSWGTGWGKYGEMDITFTDMKRLLIEDGDCTVPVLAP